MAAKPGLRLRHIPPKEVSAILSARQVKAEARRLGFSACGLAPAEPLAPWRQKERMASLQRGENGCMDYLARHTDLRADPRRLVEGARTVVSVALCYYPVHRLPAAAPQIAYYAYGRDYHDVVRGRLRQLLESLRAQDPTLEGRAFCDSAPVDERYWAWRCGLGFVGRNTQLILPHLGSYYFLGELIVTATADAYDRPLQLDCGNCRRCLDACPTGALYAPHRLDARRCLSYLTIEQRGPIPPEAAGAMGHTIYGCDRCQKACPHNRAPRPTTVAEFAPNHHLLHMTTADWQGLSHEAWCDLFRGSAVKRATYAGFMRNVRAALTPEEKSERPEKPAEKS